MLIDGNSPKTTVSEAWSNVSPFTGSQRSHRDKSTQHWHWLFTGQYKSRVTVLAVHTDAVLLSYFAFQPHSWESLACGRGTASGAFCPMRRNSKDSLVGEIPCRTDIKNTLGTHFSFLFKQTNREVKMMKATSTQNFQKDFFRQFTRAQHSCSIPQMSRGDLLFLVFFCKVCIILDQPCGKWKTANPFYLETNHGELWIMLRRVKFDYSPFMQTCSCEKIKI